MTLKPGTRIELRGTPAFPGFPGVAPEMARVARGRPENGEMPEGYHVVRFSDGGKLCVHESNFRIVDNR